jgi:hypothetical protein
MGNHAVLSPSSASRWIACTPSARLELNFPDNSGLAASEGTLAHSLGELLIKHKLKKIQNREFTKQLKAIQGDKQYENAMYDYADDYAVFVLEQFAEAQAHTKDAVIYLEQKLNLTDYVPEGFGTGDAGIIADKWLTLIDLKYGKGVPVSAEENKQMMLYALGALREYDFVYDIPMVRLIIYQPRLYNISTYEISVKELREWAETELKPRAALAFKGQGDFNPGSHCRFCKAKAVCKANADYNLEIAKHEFAEAVLLTDEDISDILNRADDFTKWISSVKEHALVEAVNNGKKWPDYKLVEGRSNRTYVDETKVADTLIKNGFPEKEIYTKKLLGITAMEKAITKPTFNSLLNTLVIKPAGKPTLVPQSDKRAEYNSVDAALLDFVDVDIDD